MDEACVKRVHLVGFITEPATVRQILEHVGERTTAPAIASARLPPLEMNRQQLATPEGVFEAIPELEFDQTANLAAEAGHDQWTHPAGTDADPIPQLEFEQTLGLQICAAQVAPAAECGWVWVWLWQGAVRVVVCQCRRIQVWQFLRVRSVNQSKIEKI